MRQLQLDRRTAAESSGCRTHCGGPQEMRMVGTVLDVLLHLLHLLHLPPPTQLLAAPNPSPLDVHAPAATALTSAG